MDARLTYRVRAGIVAAIAFAAFVALGVAVARGPDPGWMMTIEASLVNHGTLVAWWLTWFGLVYVLAPIGIALLILAWRVPSLRGRIFFSLIVLILCWRGADLAQHIFARPRRLDWVVRHETAFSYPSSHAAIATGFYLLWAAFVARSDMRGRFVAAGALVALALGIIWSRLDLAAHYATDLLGGILLAVALVALVCAVLPINVFGSATRRS